MTIFDTGIFTVGTTGTLSFDYLLDGGSYQGQLAIFNLQGIEQYTPGSTAFIQEAARRALTESNLGYVVIDDIAVGAKFKANIPWEGNSNRGTYSGIKTVTM
ncbi:subtilisin-like serine protease, partial [Argonema antarcticum A004/B2]|nr:subtilisin-like serine protease [Argonema antarcticum A004/B2]